MITRRKNQRNKHTWSKPAWLLLLAVCLLIASTTTRARIEVSHEGLSTQAIVLPRRQLVQQQATIKSAPHKAGGLRQVARLSPTIPTKMKTLPKPKLDFIISGFPKCGTTTLLYALRAHKDTDIASSERCGVTNAGISDQQAVDVLREAAAELSPSPDIKRGIKCPTILRSYKTIARIEQYSPSAKFVIGLRHPIRMLESFYNYRVTESYDKRGETFEPIPSFEDVVRRDKPWKGISKDTPRFDRNLMQFGKTRMSAGDLKHFVGRKNMAVRPSAAKIFVYTLDQLNDSNERRSQTFRHDLGSFLGLQTPLEPLGHENLNHFVGKKAHKETVDICESQYNDLRRDLLSRGEQMASWIQDEFLKSPDVTVGSRGHFLQSLDSWRIDPCLPSQESAMKNVGVKKPRRELPMTNIHVRKTKKTKQNKNQV